MYRIVGWVATPLTCPRASQSAIRRPAGRPASMPAVKSFGHATDRPQSNRRNGPRNRAADLPWRKFVIRASRRAVCLSASRACVILHVDRASLSMSLPASQFRMVWRSIAQCGSVSRHSETCMFWQSCACSLRSCNVAKGSRIIWQGSRRVRQDPH